MNDLAFVKNYRAVRERLYGKPALMPTPFIVAPPAPPSIPHPQAAIEPSRLPDKPRLPTVEQIVAGYRLAYDSKSRRHGRVPARKEVERPDPVEQLIPREKRITLREIIQDVGARRGVSITAIVSARRNVDLVLARQEAMWLAHEKTTLSIPQIARALGDRDHTTVMHGIRRHQARIDAGEVAAPDWTVDKACC